MAKPVSRQPHISEEMKLLKWDADGETHVVFMEPRRYEQEQIDRLQLSTEVIFNTREQGEVRQRDRLPWTVLETFQVCLTLVGSNLYDEETDKLIFEPGKTCRAPGKPLTEAIKDRFEKEWYSLEPALCEEIVEKLFEFYPDFDWKSDRGEE